MRLGQFLLNLVLIVAYIDNIGVQVADLGVWSVECNSSVGGSNMSGEIVVDKEVTAATGE